MVCLGAIFFLVRDAGTKVKLYLCTYISEAMLFILCVQPDKWINRWLIEILEEWERIYGFIEAWRVETCVYIMAVWGTYLNLIYSYTWTTQKLDHISSNIKSWRKMWDNWFSILISFVVRKNLETCCSLKTIVIKFKNHLICQSSCLFQIPSKFCTQPIRPTQTPRTCLYKFKSALP